MIISIPRSFAGLQTSVPLSYLDDNFSYVAGILGQNTATNRKNADQYATLNEAVATIGSTPTTLFITSTTLVGATLSIPSNITIVMEYPGLISSAFAVTINGRFIAPAIQVFSGAGTITFGDKAVWHVFAEWWGIDGVNDEVQFNAAINSLPKGGVVQCLRTEYNIQTNPIIVKDAIVIQGVAGGGTLAGGVPVGTSFYTTLSSGGAFQVYAPSLTSAATFGAFHTKFRNFFIRGDVSGGAAPVAGRHGIECRTTADSGTGYRHVIYGILIENCQFLRLDTAMKFWDTNAGGGGLAVDSQISQIQIKQCLTNECDHALYLNSSNAEVYCGPHNYFNFLDSGIVWERGRLDMNTTFGGAPSFTGLGALLHVPTTAAASALHMIGCQCEQADYFIYDEGVGSYKYPWVLMGNTIDENMTIGARTLVLIGNTYDGVAPGTADITCSSTKVISLGDNLDGTNVFDLSAGNFFTRFGSGDGKAWDSITHEILGTAVDSAVAAGTLTPTGRVFKLTGTTNVGTINIPWPGFQGRITIIPTGVLTFITGSNIAAAVTTTANVAVDFFYHTTDGLWYPLP